MQLDTLKNFLKPAMIFLPLGAGFFCPAVHRWTIVIELALIVMLYMVFLRLDISQLKLRKSHGKLLALNVAMALIPFWSFHFAGFEQLALAAFFVGITPTATAAAVVMSFLKGKVEYVVTAFVVTNVGIALLLPILLPWISGNPSVQFAGRVTESLLVVMGLPALLAYGTRKIHPAAREWPKKLSLFTFGLWSLMLFIIAGNAGNFFQENPQSSYLTVLLIGGISLVLCFLNFAVGYYVGEPGFRHEASQSLGQKNTTLTIYLALVYGGPLAAMGPIFYVLWHNTFNAIQMYLCDRKDSAKKHSETPR